MLASRCGCRGEEESTSGGAHTLSEAETVRGRPELGVARSKRATVWHAGAGETHRAGAEREEARLRFSHKDEAREGLSREERAEVLGWELATTQGE